MDMCRTKEVPLKSQPVGATGQGLEVVGIAMLNILIETTGELEDCGVLMGTNGFTVTHSDETQMEPKRLVHSAEEVIPTDQTDGKPEDKVQVLLSQVVHLCAKMSKEVKVEIVQPVTKDVHIILRVLVPEEGCLAEQQCDFTEVLWQGQSNCKVIGDMSRRPLYKARK